MSTPSRRHRWMTHHAEPPQDGPPLLMIELEPEAEQWLDTLSWPDYVAVLRYAEL